MGERVDCKIDEILNYLSELKKAVPSGFDEYKSDSIRRAACERYAEKIISAIVDLAFLVVNERGLSSPETEIEVFDVLTNEGIITSELAERLKDAKRMRNILAHEYGEVDNKIVFHAVDEELSEDTKKFILKSGFNTPQLAAIVRF